ncbi:MAG: PhoPQ-activated pathogenicity protein [Isosphaeraceae bacterium]|jgi:PhoPQ-activated pathogenicity-related protein|nr:MAG: PhoPQ-activated pathogenicity protein [Isosphaeraceae bacterium]
MAGLVWPLLGIAGMVAAQAPAGGPLFEYLARAEPAYRWDQIGNDTTPAGKIYTFELRSQTWRGGDWTHQLRVYEPAELPYPRLMLLMIAGGRVGGTVRPSDHEQGFQLARACGARVAVLPQVPNQPLLGDRYEDDLIAETFVNYLKTQEPDWPLLFPMVKSAVKAMDALEAWARERGVELDGFVVTGASKRGWTTWLTGAVDGRVKAIAPMVIPTLNMKAQAAHQRDSWGQYSEQIEDYTRRGLTEKFDDPVGRQLWKMVDPYSYLDRIRVPVLQINGTNDRYWTLDSVNLFWEAIRGPRYLCLLPNAGHGLEQNRAWAISTLGGFFRHIATGAAWPKLEFRAEDGPAGIALTFGADQVPRAVRIWVASSDSRDFRESRWAVLQEVAIPAGAAELRPYVHRMSLLPDRYTAAFVEFVYEQDGLECHLATPVVIARGNQIIRPRSVGDEEPGRR